MFSHFCYGLHSLGRARFLTSIMSSIKTFVFVDLETTGLPQFENNTTKITEMCAIAVQADHIEMGVFPRVHNKLSLCFNPNKLINPQASDITGLSNELLENQATFSSDTVNILNNWLGIHRKPICFVAHNGSRFDFPILRAEITKAESSLPDDILCLDSLEAFRFLETQEKKKPESKEEQVPYEFTAEYEEMLCRVCDEFEEKQKEAQRNNETTPTKQIIQPGVHPTGINKILFAKRTSFKLQDVYTRLTNKEPIGAHEAEGDVQMLLMCSATYGEKFVEYANSNYKKFDEVPIMKPGRKLGL